MRRAYRRRWCVVIILLAFAALVAYLRIIVAPLTMELAKAKVSNYASGIINQAIQRQLEINEIDYDKIICLEKDANGNITALKTNIAEINRLRTQVLSVMDDMLADMDVNEISLPLGNLILPEIFSGLGPRLPVKVVSVSMSDADFRNEFLEAGINQTTHQIMLDVAIIMTVLTPMGTQDVNVTSSVVVAETVIVGKIPTSYMHWN